MARPKVHQSPQERLTLLFLGQTIRNIAIDDNSFDLGTDNGTLHVTPTRFEALGATLGTAVTEHLMESDAMAFMANKTVLCAEHLQGRTVVSFTNGERIEIVGEPNIETDIKNTYVVHRVVTEELI